MGLAQIENPALAFDSANQDNYSIQSSVVFTMIAGAAITKYTIVAITYSPSTGEFSCVTAGTGTTGDFTGIAIDAATVAGQLIRVVIYGVAQVEGGATISAGAVFSAGASGKAAAASTTIGANVGIIMQAVTSSTTGVCFVGKM